MRGALGVVGVYGAQKTGNDKRKTLIYPTCQGALKTSHFEKRKVCHKHSPVPTMTGFKERCYGESTQNGYGKRNIDFKTAWLVSSTYRPRAWNQP